MEPPKVTVAPAIRRPVAEFDEYTGRVAADESVDVRARASGYLLEVTFNDGDMVTADEVLFVIDPSTYQAAYNQALAQVDLWETKHKLAQAKLARNAKLIASGAVSKEEYEESVAAANESAAAQRAAEADAAARKIDLDFTIVKSPINGKIDRTFVTKGNLVQTGPGEPTLLTRIVAVDPTYVYFDVDELSLLKYTEERRSEGDIVDRVPLRDRKIPVQITLADGSIYPELGTIDFGSNQLDPGTGTLTVRAIVANPQGSLAPGLFVRLKVPGGKGVYDAVLVAEQAIGTDQSEKFVYVVDGPGNAQRRPVVLGAKQGSDRVIKSGLNEGEQVIINGQLLVRPGKPVRAEQGQMPEPPQIDERLLQPAAEGTAPSSESGVDGAVPADALPPPHEVRRPLDR